jgi:transcription elongation factor GreB
VNKAFVKETEDDDDADGEVASPLPAGSKNYISPAGYQRLRDELVHLLDVDRPEVVRTVSWAASNGDRSENGDYLYGKKRLREIDRRIRFLTKRLDVAEVVDASSHAGSDQVFFGATVDYVVGDGRGVGDMQTLTIVGVDEAEPLAGRISWVAPIARALVKARVGDVVTLRTPGGVEDVEIVDVRYPEPVSP